jgi:hypothetical protein
VNTCVAPLCAASFSNALTMASRRVSSASIARASTRSPIARVTVLLLSALMRLKNSRSIWFSFVPISNGCASVVVNASE